METKTTLNKQIAEVIKELNYKRSNPKISLEQLKGILDGLQRLNGLLTTDYKQ